MSTTEIIPGVLWQLSLRIVNVFVLNDGNELTLIDTGTPGSEGTIAKGIEGIGRTPTDVARIIVTHCHPDHAGSLAALKRITKARAAMHSEDAAMIRRGDAMRPLFPAPGLRRRLLFRMFVAPAPRRVESAAIEVELADGSQLGGLRAIHAPGHCAGQVALLWPSHGVLFAGDAAANLMGLGLSLGYEDLELGKRSLARLAALDFQIACFGHGAPIKRGATAQFRGLWGRPAHT
jgi:glyoxylase-like metal-dependent hydrolase (beta-lactamase superfamily II)